MTILDTKEDLEWLSEVHCKIANSYKIAIIHGNEDCPERIELYSKDRYSCKPTILVRNEEGSYVVVSWGRKPQPPLDKSK